MKYAEILKLAQSKGYDSILVFPGCMDIAGAPNDFTLPKQLLCAIYKEMTNQRTPLHTESKKSMENIYRHL